MKGTAKFKNSLFEPPFGGLMGNAQGSSKPLWLDEKHIVDFMLVIVELFFASSHDCGTIKRNMSKSAFLKEWVSLSANFM